MAAISSAITTAGMAATNSTSYLYNALGQLVEKATTVPSNLYVYDEAGHIIGEYDGSGNLVEETVWLGDIPVATVQPSGSSIAISYVHSSHLNTPTKITRSSDNALEWRIDQDPFGSAAPNQNPGGLGTFVYNLRLPGQLYMADSGLNYNYKRDYDPSIGRYVESDPIGLYGQSYSTYLYAAGDAIIYIDPFGLCWVYSQSTGQLSHVDAAGNVTVVGSGYAGYGAGLNNPAMQNVAGQQPSPSGPLPQGGYTIGQQQTNITQAGKVLPGSMRLTPNPDTQMYNRGGFLIHGPHANDQHNSSDGCPIFNQTIRNQIGSSGDNCLQVVQ
jgi:RHS repeat-associated protein